MLEKLQRMCALQLTGKHLPVDFGSYPDDEKHELLRQNFAGINVLLCLDDLWDEDSEKHLNFVDDSTASRVVISTRVRGLLKGAQAVELKPPSHQDAVKILMSAAEMPAGAEVPRESAKIIDMCDSLPLSLVMAGRLIAQLGLGSDWKGVTDILDQELRENEVASSEQRVIKASLAGLRCSDRDRTGVNNLCAAMLSTSCTLMLTILWQTVIDTPCGCGSRVVCACT